MILRAGLSGHGSLGGDEGEGEGVKMDKAQSSRRVHNGRWTYIRPPSYPALYRTSILRDTWVHRQWENPTPLAPLITCYYSNKVCLPEEIRRGTDRMVLELAVYMPWISSEASGIPP